MLEFQALVNRKRFLESVNGENSPAEFDSFFRDTRIEDLCLDFTLPGYPNYVLASGPDYKMVVCPQCDCSLSFFFLLHDLSIDCNNLVYFIHVALPG